MCIPPRVCARCDNTSRLYGLNTKQGLRKPPIVQSGMYQEKAHAVDTCGHEDVVEASWSVKLWNLTPSNCDTGTYVLTLVAMVRILWRDMLCMSNGHTTSTSGSVHTSISSIILYCWLSINFVLLSHDSTVWSGSNIHSHWLGLLAFVQICRWASVCLVRPSAK